MADLAMRLTVNQKDIGSNPIMPANLRDIDITAIMKDCRSFNGGSIPPCPAKKEKLWTTNFR